VIYDPWFYLLNPVARAVRWLFELFIQGVKAQCWVGAVWFALLFALLCFRQE